MNSQVRKEAHPMNRFWGIAIAAGATLAALALPTNAVGIEATLMKESAGAGLATASCPLSTSTDGTAANYRWYNVCSGYIWIYSSFGMDEGSGVLFGGPEQPEVNDSNIVKRAITYYRNVLLNYSQTVDVYVEPDFEGDGCPDATWLADFNLDPGLRWNCSEFNAPILDGIEYLIVRWTHNGGAAPTIATDGPYTEECDPMGSPRSFYYSIGQTACVVWTGRSGRYDNFLFWLILDRGAPNSTQPSTWGAIKGLFR